MTGEAGPLNRTTGTTNNTDMDTGKLLNNSRKSDTFSHMFSCEQPAKNRSVLSYSLPQSATKSSREAFPQVQTEHVLSQASGILSRSKTSVRPPGQGVRKGCGRFVAIFGDRERDWGGGGGGEGGRGLDQ